MAIDTRLQNYLEQVGLTDIEAKLYILLLNSGPISVRDLASLAGIKRTTSYLYIDQLAEKGLVTKIVKGSKKMVSAAQPNDSLKHLVDEKLKSAKLVHQEFPDILQAINVSLPRPKSSDEAEIKYFKGISGVRRIYEEAFKGREIRSYVKIVEDTKLSPDKNNANLFNNALNRNKNLKIWEIVYKSPFSKQQAMKILSQNNSYFYKFMPKDLNWSITSEDIVIYDGNVAIIDYKGKISSVILQSQDFYNNSKHLFDFIWRMLPKPS